jgi:hypothetical protein
MAHDVARVRLFAPGSDRTGWTTFERLSPVPGVRVGALISGGAPVLKTESNPESKIEGDPPRL